MSVLEINTSVYMWKEERNQGRKAGSKPCGLAHTDTGFWICGRYTDFSAFLPWFLSSFHIYTEVFISNIDVEICCWNRSSTRTISFLDSLHMCKKSASLISVHRDLMIRTENFTGPYSINSMGKNQNKNNHTYAECICHNWISSLYTEDKHKTSDRLNFNRASEWD